MAFIEVYIRYKYNLYRKIKALTWAFRYW